MACSAAQRRVDAQRISMLWLTLPAFSSIVDQAGTGDLSKQHRQDAVQRTSDLLAVLPAHLLRSLIKLLQGLSSL